jgi:hypothetical protein
MGDPLHVNRGDADLQRQPDTAVLSQTCEEKRRLFLAYQGATAIYSQMVKELAGAAGSVVYAEFEFVNRRVQAARKASLEARELLKKHSEGHKC